MILWYCMIMLALCDMLHQCYSPWAVCVWEERRPSVQHQLLSVLICLSCLQAAGTRYGRHMKSENVLYNLLDGADKSTAIWPDESNRLVLVEDTVAGPFLVQQLRRDKGFDNYHKCRYIIFFCFITIHEHHILVSVLFWSCLLWKQTKISYMLKYLSW